jgi:hypothetical protein
MSTERSGAVAGVTKVTEGRPSAPIVPSAADRAARSNSRA